MTNCYICGETNVYIIGELELNSYSDYDLNGVKICDLCIKDLINKIERNKRNFSKKECLG